MTVDPWWRDGVVYQVYMRSFADSNGDGIGDLPGIEAKLPYLVDLGVDALWLTPFYPSPMHDHGYDVADYTDVDPLFGTLADFDSLLAAAHEAGLRLIVDLVPNHTSSEHPWFKEALADPQSPKRDWYIFRKPDANGHPPNHWQSVFGGPAWTLDEASGEFYLHLFDTSQPDLNWRNPEVHAAWEAILRFWLDRGVDGFRIDVAHGLYKDPDLRDNPPVANVPTGTEHLTTSGVSMVWDQPEVLTVYERWREITDSYPGERVMVGEVFLYDVSRVRRYVGRTRLHQAFNFLVMSQPFEAVALRRTLTTALEAFAGDGSGPTWVLSNHDLVRHATRYGGGELGIRRGLAATLCLLALPGSPYVYEGEELGLEQSDVPAKLRQDPIFLRSKGKAVGRDGCRTPMPWATGSGHGFTTGHPWLPFGADADAKAVAVETDDPDSVLSAYRRAIHVRRQLRDHLGDGVRWLVAPEGSLAFARACDNGSELVCVLVTADDAVSLQLPVGTSVEVLLAPNGVEASAESVTFPAASTAWLQVPAGTWPTASDLPPLPAAELHPAATASIAATSMSATPTTDKSSAETPSTVTLSAPGAKA